MPKVKIIKTFEEACEKLDLKPDALPEVSMLPEKHQAALVAHYKLVVIAQALNDGWEPDWTDSNQWKYYPWFDMRSGSGLSFFVYADWTSITCVGSRLCYKTRELAEYAAKQFLDLYKEYFVIS